jgi:hypothetical protein
MTTIFPSPVLKLSMKDSRAITHEDGEPVTAKLLLGSESYQLAPRRRLSWSVLLV